MSTLPVPLRRQLERAALEARKVAEAGARKALEGLGVHEPEPYRHMDGTQRELRRRLRAQARQLGDEGSRTQRGAYESRHLAEKLAYDQWHRLLFARFLLENNLLISHEHSVSVSLDDCEELAQSLGLKDAWAVAARFAAVELPEIFRADDPVGAVELPVEDRKKLIQLVSALPVDVFTASDSLGWCYQFWQAERKDQINASGNKIGADELPAVTQLFTEDYMVDFLLDNTLGAWHAGKVLAQNRKLAEDAKTEEALRSAVAFAGCPWIYLRFIQGKDGKWTPAAGTFDGWPKSAQDLRCLDPCMGSGHFVVAMFERLVTLRMAEENLNEATAVAAVIRDNLFGLEIDPRCTQIGAFNLALSAWRRVGHCKLPPMNLACSGLAPNAKKDDWLKLAGDNDRLQRGMERLYSLFRDAPVLGSLINPRTNGDDLVDAEFHELQPLLEKALAQETKDNTAHEMAVTARGLAKAAEILASQFTLVSTNVPFLGRRKQIGALKDHCERAYPNAKADVATCFIERCLIFCFEGSTTILVTPQSWLFLKTFETLRRKLLDNSEFLFFVRLGPNAFQGMNWPGLTTAIFSITRTNNSEDHLFAGLDVSEFHEREDKASNLSRKRVSILNQNKQLKNPGASLVLEKASDLALLSKYADSIQGASTLDIEMFRFFFWEVNVGNEWVPHQSSPSEGAMFSGMEYVSIQRKVGGRFDKFAAELKAEKRLGGAWSGQPVWGKLGIACAWMGKLPSAIYLGVVYDNSIAAIVPKHQLDLPAVWCFCSSPDFLSEVRKINQKSQVANATLVNVPFDHSHWQKIAAERYPRGLPKPFSSDPTQWLFNGSPKGSDQPLQVAVARLLGYHWPRQTGSSFPDCPALSLDGLEKLADNDGIVPISPAKGEGPAAERLRELLASAYGKDWSATKQVELLAQVDYAGASLEDWLRNGFFEQHCTLFHHRPFIWHIWDGHKSGFSALVNYHRLSHANLEKLTFSYLGDWIRRQQAAVEAGEAGSDARLEAAKQMQTTLKLILEGEPPYDIFVRWKPLSKQAIGWHPDVNDGVRMNIRPFAAADILRKRVKIKWEKDRGKEPQRDKLEYPWFWGWDGKKSDFMGVGKEPDGNRWNDCHFTNEFKKKAREANKKK